MVEYSIAPQDEGQSVIKYLEKVLPGAKGGVIFKALRKKNIVLNGKKTGGKEILKAGDSIKVFFSDETIESFKPKYGKDIKPLRVKKESLKSFEKNLIYEDDNVLIVNKDPGVLTQSDGSGLISLNDILLTYLGDSVKNYAVKPSVCNRLDRNTSGIVLCGKTQKGLKGLSLILRERSLRKLYYAVCLGDIKEPLKLGGFLHKDKSENKAVITDTRTSDDSDPVETEAYPKGKLNIRGQILTLLEVRLITGKPHQIRAHMLYAGHPVIGDIKYCTDVSVSISKELKAGRQFLHAYRVEFPKIKGDLSYLSGKSFEAKLKDDMNSILKYRV